MPTCQSCSPEWSPSTQKSSDDAQLLDEKANVFGDLLLRFDSNCCRLEVTSILSLTSVQLISKFAELWTINYDCRDVSAFVHFSSLKSSPISGSVI